MDSYNNQSRNWGPCRPTVTSWSRRSTSTVPIYLGAREVRHFFNTESMLTFVTETELTDIVDSFQRCQSFRTMEDYIDRVHFGLAEG